MSETTSRPHRIGHPRHFFIDGVWAEPSSSGTIDVVDSATEEVFLTVARAEAADIADAVSAARRAFNTCPWPRMSHAERAFIMNRIADGWMQRAEALAESWVMESGALHAMSKHSAAGVAATFRYYAGLTETLPGRKNTFR